MQYSSDIYEKKHVFAVSLYKPYVKLFDLTTKLFSNSLNAGIERFLGKHTKIFSENW